MRGHNRCDKGGVNGVSYRGGKRGSNWSCLSPHGRGNASMGPAQPAVQDGAGCGGGPARPGSRLKAGEADVAVGADARVRRKLPTATETADRDCRT